MGQREVLTVHAFFRPVMQDEVSSWEGKNRKQDSHPQLKNSFPECFGLWGRCYRKGTALLSL